MDFQEFLKENQEAIRQIAASMQCKNYNPMKDKSPLSTILNMVHTDVAALASRYVAIINELLTDNE